MKLLIEARRQGYATDQVGSTMTVEELIELLEGYEGDTPVYISNDEGYTYGALKHWDIREEYEEDPEEE